MFSNLQSRSYGLTNKRKLYNSANGNLDFIQRLKLEKKLTVHSGCVNTICWNETGTTILSGSDDQYLVISDPFNEKTLHKLHSGHRANIFSAKYLPSTDDTELISCSGDGKIIYNNVLREDTYGTNVFNCHFGTTYEVITIPNEASTFLSCGEDGTVRFYDLRAKTSCTKSECKDDVLINSRSAVTAIAANPLLPWQLAVGCSDSTARVYDRRMLGTRATGNYKGKGITGLVSLFTPPSLESMSYRITSLNYSPDGEDMLVSYSSEYIYLYGTKDPSKLVQLSKRLAQSTGKNETNREDGSVQPEPGTSSGVRGEDVDDNNDTGARPSSVKRLRLRGDWSDTGPGARPERERRQNPQPSVSNQPEEGTAENPRITIMQRMSDLLTRWLDGNLRQNPEEGHQHENLGDERNQPSVSAPSSGQMSDTSQSGGVSDTTQGEGQPADTQPRVRILEDIVYTDSDEANVNDETMEAVDSKSNVDETQTDPASTTTDDSVNHTETDTDSVMYNPLEPTSYIHQHKSHTNKSDGIGPSHSKDDISQTDQSVQAGSSISSQPSQTECNVGSSASPPEERAIMQQTQQAVDELKNRNVAPIISLHYSTEGTSYSNIRLRFASLGSHTDIQTDNREGSSTGLHLDVTPHGHQDVHEDSRRSEIVNENVSGASSRSEIDSSEGPVDTGQVTTKQTGGESLHTDNTQTDMKHGGADFDHTHIVTDNSDGDFMPDSSNVVDNNQRTARSETSMNLDKDESSAMDISDAETEQTTHDNEHIEDNDKAIVTESQSLSVSADDKVCDSSDNVRDESKLAVTEDCAEASCSGVGHRSDIGEGTDCTMDTVPPALQPDVDDKHDNDEDRMYVDDSTQSVEQSEKQRPQTQPSQRRRRIGYSGPPTGNFTLPSADDRHNSSSSSSSDDDDDDVEPRNVLQRPRIDRTTAALRLQAFHRKRQEAKERREMDDKSIYKPKLRKVYKGHRNARTMIKEANFWGNNFIVSGSDCGHIFIWDRHSSEPVMLLEADKHVVNCVQPHPYNVLLASSGIDYDIKLWSPLHEKSAYDEERTKEVMHRNQIMLEETRDTITVPAAFMLRVLASINNIRSGRRTDRAEADGSEAGQGREDTDSD